MPNTKSKEELGKLLWKKRFFNFLVDDFADISDGMSYLENIIRKLESSEILTDNEIAKLITISKSRAHFMLMDVKDSEKIVREFLYHLQDYV